jgi:hypothetical protein
MDNALILLIGFTAVLLIMVVAEAVAKKLGWE